MSFSSPREVAGAEAARAGAENAENLANIAFPEIRSALTHAFGDLNTTENGSAGIPNSVQQQFGKVREGVNRDFDVAERGVSAYTTQNFKQSGNPYSQAQLDDSLMASARTLEEARGGAMRRLQFEEANAGMTQFNNLMNLMSGGSGAAMNLGGGFGQSQNAALSMLPNSSRGGSAMAGAFSGAAAGTAANPGWGTLIGALAGAAGGYFGSQG